MTICKNCGKLTSNPKFCSRSCSATFTNKQTPKRKKRDWFCEICGVKIPSRRKRCEKHRTHNLNWAKITYKTLTGQATYQKNSRIRQLARIAYTKTHKDKMCTICDYDKHIHICHIKPINTFSDDTTIAVINSPDNLVALCPNHHWELDNGILNFEPLMGLEPT